MVALGMVVHASLLQCGGKPDHERENHSLRRVLQDLITELARHADTTH